MKFAKLAENLEESVRNMYWVNSVPDTINRQTLFSTLLYYDIVPENEKKAALDSLFKAVSKAPARHFTTGIFGTKYILESLSASGKQDAVFNIVDSKTYPGWGFMIDRGATTIWETWKESDNVYSNCHPMFGSITEWFYRWIGGIQPDPENPGFRKFRVSPFLPSDLSFANCSYESPFGTITSNWKKSTKGTTHEVSVPNGTSATFVVSSGGKKSFSIKNTATGNSITKDASGSLFTTELPEGSYLITY
jgi:alpha-L-rhamnosidase